MTPIQELEHVIGEMGQRIDQLRARAEQAEARAAELSGLLEEAIVLFDTFPRTSAKKNYALVNALEAIWLPKVKALASRPAKGGQG